MNGMSSHRNYYYEKPTKKEERKNSNPRYRFYRQGHFTAGDCEQFMQHWKYSPPRSREEGEEDLKKVVEKWPTIYKTIGVRSITDTFHYLFHVMKKGVFVSIRNHQLSVFLPFSKMEYQNSWGSQLKWNRHEFPTLSDLFRHVCVRSNIPFDEKRIHSDMKCWYANNGLIRYEYPPTEGDSGVNMIHDMLLQLCDSSVPLPDVDFFINKRDFPLLRRDRKEAYENLHKGMKMEKMGTPWDACKIDSFVPILSMTTSVDHADLMIPTWDDWSRASYQMDGRVFSREYREYPDIPMESFSSKIPTAVFRGASTGLGVRYVDNPRLFFAKLNLKHRKHPSTRLPYLDCGITKWNLRPRKKDLFLDTISSSILDEIPLIPPLSPLQQSKYKYILHLPGHSCAYRLSYELSMNSVIIFYPCRYKLWYMSMLKPYVHYVPLMMSAEGHVNIYKTIDWCIGHEKECEEIAKNARAFYDQYLGWDGILTYWSQLLFQIQREMTPVSPKDGGIDENEDHNDKGKYSLQVYQKEWQKKSLDEKRVTMIHWLEKECPEVFEFIREKCSNIEIWKQELHRSYKDKDIVTVLWEAWKTYQPDRVKELEDHIMSLKLEKSSPRVKVWKWVFGNQIFCCKLRIPNPWDEESIHENYIHSHILSGWKDQIPNFVRQYTCLPSGLKVMDWVEGPSLETMLSSSYFQEAKDAVLQVVDIFSQLCLALHMAQMSNGFMHMDLYPWNVMVSILSAPKQLEYTLDSKRRITCESQFVPVMVDMAKSFAMDGQGRFSSCIEPMIPSPLHDMKCIVFSSLHLILSNFTINDKIVQMILPLVCFFQPELSGRKFTLFGLKKLVKYHKKFSVMLFSETSCLYGKKSVLDFFQFLQTYSKKNTTSSTHTHLSTFSYHETKNEKKIDDLPFPLYYSIFSQESALSISLKMLPWYKYHYPLQMEQWKKRIYTQYLSTEKNSRMRGESFDFHSLYFLQQACEIIGTEFPPSPHQRIETSMFHRLHTEYTQYKQWHPKEDSIIPLYASHVDPHDLREKVKTCWEKAIESDEELQTWRMKLWEDWKEKKTCTTSSSSFIDDNIDTNIDSNIDSNIDTFYQNDHIWMLHLSSAPVFYIKTFLETA